METLPIYFIQAIAAYRPQKRPVHILPLHHTMTL